MEHQIAQSAVTLLALLTTTFTYPDPQATPAAKAVHTKEVYVVKEGDSLTSIAKATYGKHEYWTNIWNDNSSIENPSRIEKNLKLTIEKKDGEAIEPLNQPLQKRLDTFKQQASPFASSSAKATVQTPSSSHVAGPLTDVQLTYLGNCESGMTATRNSGNGYYGAFQFSIGTWNSMGTGYERADLAPLEVQKEAVQRLLSRSSIFTQFPGCARKMQAEGLL